MSAALEVNECKIWATGVGTDWWNLFRNQWYRMDRLTVLTTSLGGDIVSVACDDREHAEWLRDTAIANGIHKSALTIRKGRA